jgi:hypothetical protein
MADDDVPDEQPTGGREEPEMMFDPTLRRFVRHDLPEGSHPAPAAAALGVGSLLVVSAVGFFAGLQEPGFFGCAGGRLSGANIDLALLVAWVGGLAAAFVIGLASFWSDYLVAASSVLSAAMLAVALALVARDSATYTCGVSAGTDRSTDHFGYLYALWGVPLVVLLFAAVRALRNARRPARANPG